MKCRLYKNKCVCKVRTLTEDTFVVKLNYQEYLSCPNERCNCSAFFCLSKQENEKNNIKVNNIPILRAVSSRVTMFSLNITENASDRMISNSIRPRNIRYELLPNTRFKISVTRAAGSFLIFFSSSAT